MVVLGVDVKGVGLVEDVIDVAVELKTCLRLKL